MSDSFEGLEKSFCAAGWFNSHIIGLDVLWQRLCESYVLLEFSITEEVPVTHTKGAQ